MYVCVCLCLCLCKRTLYVCMYVCMYVGRYVCNIVGNAPKTVSADRTQVPARFSGLNHTGFDVHPTFYTIGTRSFSRGHSGRIMAFTMHPLLVPMLSKGRATALQSLCVCSASYTTTLTFKYVVQGYSKWLSGF
jgi:hypothetical protein